MNKLPEQRETAQTQAAADQETIVMPARKIEFRSEATEKAFNDEAKRVEGANETLRSERRAIETLQFERGYN